MIEIENLTKIYKKKVEKKKIEVKALDNINFKIEKGDIFGIIGPNGAGKTTLLKIISTLIIPDEGRITVDGYDVIKDEDIVKEKVGLLAGEFVRSLYWRLSGENNLKFFAKLRGLKNPDERVKELIMKFGLEDSKDELVMKYSTGMKHKLTMAVGLLNDPPIILLDEPLTGIDPITAFEIKKLIKNEFKEKTIIWTTHNLNEIEEMCNRLSIINKGKVVLEGEPEKIKAEHWGYSKILLVVKNRVDAFSLIKDAEIKQNTVLIKTNDVGKTLFEIMKIAEKENVVIEEIETLKPKLEEIFIKGIENV